MAILRISDYLQVHRERANATLLKVKELHSPVSRSEWRAHFAVRDISTRHDDPEALYVHAVPEDIGTYIKLGALFSDIQRELDETWAALGEVYGRRGELANLGLTVRRIRSNLESREKLEQLVPYIPVAARFEGAGAPLLNLLVGPLYSDNPEFAVRELEQNAVDACRELHELSGNSNRSGHADAGPDVLVEIEECEDGTGWITVTDRGVGMTLETITRYYLVAGASFRNSDTWKRQHIDVAGEVRPLRSGRFGIGVLAAFLLGDEITVVTRHFTQPEPAGIEFTARIDDATIEFRRRSARVGTAIKVRICDPDVLDRLRPNYRNARFGIDGRMRRTGGVARLTEWNSVDWFRQCTPSICCRWNGYSSRHYAPALNRGSRSKMEFRPQTHALVPLPGQRLAPWKSLRNPQPYKAVFWRFANERLEEQAGPYRQHEQIIVNGIRVTEIPGAHGNPPFIRTREESVAPQLYPPYIVNQPSLAIADPAGVCPINLQRTSVSLEQMGLHERLARNVLSAYVRTIATMARPCRGIAGLLELHESAQKMPDVRYVGSVGPFCATRSGYALVTSKTLRELEIDTLIVLDTEGELRTVELTDLRVGEAVLVRAYKGRQATIDWFRDFWGGLLGKRVHDLVYGVPDCEVSAAASILHKSTWDIMTKQKVAARVRDALRRTVHDRARHLTRYLVSAVPHEESRALGTRIGQLARRLGPTAEIFAWRIKPGSYQETPVSYMEQEWLKAFGRTTLK